MLRKNQLISEQTVRLLGAIDKFAESQGYHGPSRYNFKLTTIANIDAGFKYRGLHDVWVDDFVRCYCLCRTDRDSDGSKVYTAYQLWMGKNKSLASIRKLLRFLRFYAQKQGYKRLYVISSRVDKIRAYARGLGPRFKVSSVNFVDEF